MTIGEVAGWAALAAVVTLVLSGIALALFFGGAGSFWGPVNDLLVSATLLLLLPVMVAAWRLAPDDAGPWFGIITVAAIAGALLAAIGQALLVAGVISLNTSFVTGGIGVTPILAWMVALLVLVFTRDIVAITVGWLLLGALVGSVLLTVSWLVGPVWLTATLGTGLVVLLAAWLATLSGELRAAI